MKLEELKEKKVAIYGAGREGQAVIKLLQTVYPDQALTLINDSSLTDSWENFKTTLSSPENIEIRIPPETSHKLLRNFDIIIKSPGVSLYRSDIQDALTHGTRISSGTNIWFAEHGGQKVIAITGTKGKSTTTSLISFILSKLGYSVKTLGNLGTPLASSLLEDTLPDFWVLELSSFQTADLDYSPDIAVFTSLYPCHLDWHLNYDNYRRDKLNLFKVRSKTPQAVINAQNPEITRLNFETPSILNFNHQDTVYFDSDFIYSDSVRLFPTSTLKLPGAHNLSNLCAALSVLKSLKIPLAGLEEIISQFQGLPHRLETVYSFAGLRYVNDSIATVPEATIAALQAFNENKVCLIIGGQDKSQDWSTLARHIAESPPAVIIGIPDSGTEMLLRIQEACAAGSLKSPPCYEAENLEEAVILSRKQLRHGGIILLSPGAPSYGHYRNFEERGEHFRQLASNAE